MQYCVPNFVDCRTIFDLTCTDRTLYQNRISRMKFFYGTRKLEKCKFKRFSITYLQLFRLWLYFSNVNYPNSENCARLLDSYYYVWNSVSWPTPQSSFPKYTLKIQFHTGVAQRTGWFINYKVAVEGNNVNLTELLFCRKIWSLADQQLFHWHPVLTSTVKWFCAFLQVRNLN